MAGINYIEYLQDPQEKRLRELINIIIGSTGGMGLDGDFEFPVAFWLDHDQITYANGFRTDTQGRWLINHLDRQPDPLTIPQRSRLNIFSKDASGALTIHAEQDIAGISHAAYFSAPFGGGLRLHCLNKCITAVSTGLGAFSAEHSGNFTVLEGGMSTHGGAALAGANAADVATLLADVNSPFGTHTLAGFVVSSDDGPALYVVPEQNSPYGAAIWVPFNSAAEGLKLHNRNAKNAATIVQDQDWPTDDPGRTADDNAHSLKLERSSVFNAGGDNTAPVFHIDDSSTATGPLLKVEKNGDDAFCVNADGTTEIGNATTITPPQYFATIDAAGTIDVTASWVHVDTITGVNASGVDVNLPTSPKNGQEVSISVRSAFPTARFLRLDPNSIGRTIGGAATFDLQNASSSVQLKYAETPNMWIIMGGYNL